MSANPRQPNPIANDPGLVGSLQSEVATEASPLMSFLITHARKIALILVIFILAIVGYSFYSWHADGKRAEESKELGKLLVISDPAMRMEKLEAFIGNAPDSVRRSAWFAILDAAEQLQDNDKIVNAWKRIGEMDDAMKVPAALGAAKNLANQEKYAEALQTLEDAAKRKLAPSDLLSVNTRIALLAEVTGDIPRALAACDAIINEPALSNETKFWIQKRAGLEKQLSESPKAASGDK